MIFTQVGECEWTVPGGVTLLSQMLIVGGGGAGGHDAGGGGGAGGVVFLTNSTVSAGSTMTVTVGGGGQSKSVYAYPSASNGSPSSVSGSGLSLVALGGGQGGSGGDDGASGGSGGGAGYNNQDGGQFGGAALQAAPGLGFPGGNSVSSSAAGGGGAAGQGITGSVGNVPDQAGSGGPGCSSDIQGSLAYFAGGGAGGSGRVGTPAAGGIGGGGSGFRADNGSGTVYSTAGQASTGGGGGGGHSQPAGGSSAGGSGIVVIRYGNSATEPVGSCTEALAGPDNFAQITDTVATCNSVFTVGEYPSLSTVQYSTRRGLINQVNPGVFYYWAEVDLGAGGGEVVSQSASEGLSRWFAQAAGSQLFTTDCQTVKNARVSTSNSGITSATGNGISEDTYYVAVKYAATSLTGATAPGTDPKYSFISSAGSETVDLDITRK